jgi:hypothetical protein
MRAEKIRKQISEASTWAEVHCTSDEEFVTAQQIARDIGRLDLKIFPPKENILLSGEAIERGLLIK